MQRNGNKRSGARLAGKAHVAPPLPLILRSDRTQQQDGTTRTKHRSEEDS